MTSRLCGFGKKPGDALGQHGTDIMNFQKIGLARIQQRVEGAEMPRQILGCRFADMADAECVNESRQRSGRLLSIAAITFAADFSAIRSSAASSSPSSL